MDTAENVNAKVTRVVDGDTVKIRINGRVETVRYIGIDTPESVKPGSPVECYGSEAGKFNEKLVEGREVRLSFDRERRDRYDRLLAYVYLRDDPQVSVNETLVRKGYARTLSIKPNTRFRSRLNKLEDLARKAGRGLWSECR